MEVPIYKEVKWSKPPPLFLQYLFPYPGQEEWFCQLASLFHGAHRGAGDNLALIHQTFLLLYLFIFKALWRDFRHYLHCFCWFFFFKSEIFSDFWIFWPFLTIFGFFGFFMDFLDFFGFLWILDLFFLIFWFFFWIFLIFFGFFEIFGVFWILWFCEVFWFLFFFFWIFSVFWDSLQSY